MDKKLKSTENDKLERSLKALKKGNFQNDFGIDVDCYVLDDEDGTAVISQTGMSKSLGLAERGNSLPRFVSGKIISKYVGAELRQKIENPLIFQGISAAPNIVHGYDVTILIDICKAILTARSNSELRNPRYDNVVKQAQILTTASAKAGIKDLVYALAGYDATREEVIKSFKLYVSEEAREYEREFPNQLYDEWYRLYNLKVPARNKPWKFMHLTIKQVYEPLANSNGEIYKLLKDTKSKDRKNRNKRLFQFLEAVGAVALRQHLGQLLGIARISKTEKEYEKHFETLFGKNVQISMDDYLSYDDDDNQLSDFNNNLKKALDYQDK